MRGCMELYEEILLHLLKRNPELCMQTSDSLVDLIELNCYQTLKKIKAIIEDDSLDDPECFYKIEQIVCLLEKIGSDGGNRHDFG